MRLLKVLGLFLLLLAVLAGCGSEGEDATTANSAPVANAGADQNLSTGSIVTLDGTASSDADKNTLTYSWSFVSKPTGSTVTLSTTTVAKPTFTADLDGSYVLQLTVNDGTVNSSADMVTVTAATANSAPVASAGVDQNVSTGTTVTLDGSASSDVNGDTLTYIWNFVSSPAGSAATLSSTTVAKPTFTADLDGSYVLQLTVNDGTVNSSADTVTVTAATANSAPVADAGPDQNVATGTAVTLDGSASSDANGDTLTYNWSFVSSPTGSAATLSSATDAKPTFTADLDGSYVLQLVVNDGTVNSSTDTVSVTAATANSAPVANAGPDQNVATGTTVTLDGSASSDANGDTLTYNWIFVSSPTGSAATLSSATDAKPTFTADLDGSYVLQLVVNDGTVNSSTDTVTVNADSPRFIDNGNNTITDTTTGLVWTKYANIYGSDTLGSFQILVGLYKNVIPGNWRVPTLEEMSSLVDTSRSNPALPAGHPFSGVLSGYYWTITTGNNTIEKWTVDMNSGSVVSQGTGSRNYLWPVKFGP